MEGKMTAIVEGEQAARGDEGPSMLSVDLVIKPLKKHGKQLVCGITGSVVDGGVVQLGSANSHTMTFQQVDGDVPGIENVPETDEPFCSKTDDCPKKGDQIAQFANPPRVSADGRTLTVIADPGTDSIVHYALRFKDENDKTLRWDPIIINN
jgi:hypothetical protein